MGREEPAYTVVLSRTRDRNRYGISPGGVVHQSDGRELAEAIAHLYESRGAPCTITTATERRKLAWWMKL